MEHEAETNYGFCLSNNLPGHSLSKEQTCVCEFGKIKEPNHRLILTEIPYAS